MFGFLKKIQIFCFVLYCGLVFYSCNQCTDQTPSIGSEFKDGFERGDLGTDWYSFGGQWKIKEGRIYSPIANNAPLWLNRKMPCDVQIDFDAESKSDAVDTKCEIFGDGKNHQSGYIIILGGWNNSLSVIARLDEHGKDRKPKRAGGEQKDKVYHWTIQRRGGNIKWLLDGAEYMTYNDPEPLCGAKHNRFAFSNWQSDVYFDNLVIKPLN